MGKAAALWAQLYKSRAGFLSEKNNIQEQKATKTSYWPLAQNYININYATK